MDHANSHDDAGQVGTALAPPARPERARNRHPWALLAVLVPLLFCIIVAIGVYLMVHRRMAFFRPAPVGRMIPSAAPLDKA